MIIYLIKKKKGAKQSSQEMAKGALGLAIEHESSGAPYLAEEAGYISITDTKVYWALLRAASPCGIDMEERSRKVSASVVRKLHPLEQQYLSGLSEGSSEWKEEFLSIWVRKEAYLKMTKEGLSLGLSKFSVLDGSLEYAGKTQAEGHPEGILLPLDPSRGLLMAICTAQEEPLEEMRWVEYNPAPKADIMDAAGKLLSAKGYTEKNLVKQLVSKGYTQDAAQDAAGRLKELGYIDDAAYAQDYVRSAARSGKGKRRIASELMQKGADGRVTREALNALAEDEDALSEKDRAMAQAKKLLRGSEKPDEKTLARIGRRLAALGYEAPVIWDVLGKLRS